MSPISTRSRLGSFMGSFEKLDWNCYYIIEKRAFTPNRLSRDKLKKASVWEKYPIWIMKTRNLNWEQISCNPESGYLRLSVLYMCFFLCVKNQETICKTVRITRPLLEAGSIYTQRWCTLKQAQQHQTISIRGFLPSLRWRSLFLPCPPLLVVL